MNTLGLQTLHTAGITEPEVVTCRNTPDRIFYQANESLILRNARYVGLRVGKGQNLRWSKLCRIQCRERNLLVVLRATAFSKGQVHEDLLAFGEIPSTNQRAISPHGQLVRDVARDLPPGSKKRYGSGSRPCLPFDFIGRGGRI